MEKTDFLFFSFSSGFYLIICFHELREGTFIKPSSQSIAANVINMRQFSLRNYKRTEKLPSIHFCDIKCSNKLNDRRKTNGKAFRGIVGGGWGEIRGTLNYFITNYIHKRISPRCVLWRSLCTDLILIEIFFSPNSIYKIKIFFNFDGHGPITSRHSFHLH